MSSNPNYNDDVRNQYTDEADVTEQQNKTSPQQHRATVADQQSRVEEGQENTQPHQQSGRDDQPSGPYAVQGRRGSLDQPAQNEAMRRGEGAARGTDQSPYDGTMQAQNGYNETQGSGYGQAQNSMEPAQNPAQAQEGYDPAGSGVRHAKNQPGKRVDVPGRETGTAWGEDQQMGVITDTPDRKNPAN